MDADLRARFDARARIVKALAHGTRLFIVSELGLGERCVRDLTALVEADMSTVSKHLTVLRNAGLIGAEKRGNQVFYKLRCTCIEAFLECVESVLRGKVTEQTQLAAPCACVRLPGETTGSAS